MPPAVRMCPSPARTSVDAPISSPGVTPSMTPGIARLADRRDAAVADADVGLVDAGAVDDDGVGDHEVGRARRRGWRVGDWPMPSRMTLPPPNFASSP